MAVRKIGQRWYYDFRIRRTRYREVIPEARTKAQAEQAEIKIRNRFFEGKYGSQADTVMLAAALHQKSILNQKSGS
jgi:Cys-tRNA synthase (O-phospho-L-seryl-tRNA:Cys-tRNA synthase)